MAALGNGVSLNEEQKKAVFYDKGPLLIIAGAGTGKTYVIAEKVKHLIEKKKAKPEEILALTFTEKAAFEMEDRVDKTLPYGYFQMWISTFHSFADQILREEIAHIGLTPTYKLLTQAESVIFLRNRLFLFNLKYFRPLGNPNKFLEALLAHFSRLRDEDISPEEYLTWAKRKRSDIPQQEREKNLELAHAYDAYQKIKIKEGCLDFSDLLYYLLVLFRKRKNILLKYQEQFRYVLVDEFQDTNIAQYDLIKLLCPPKTNPQLTVVGDDSQAIYKFRGASVSNILTFMKDYKTAKQVTLKKNYRSSQTLLDAAYKLIRHNDPDTLEAHLGISKNLISVRNNQTSEVGFFLADRVEEEAEFIAKEVLRLKKKYAFSDFAILVRANNHADPFYRALARRGIPSQFLGPGMLFKQPEVKDLIAYLTFLSDLEDSVSLYRVLDMEIFKLDKKDVALLLSFSKKTSLSLFHAIEIYLGLHMKELAREEFGIYKDHLPLLKTESKEKLYKIYTMILRHLTRVKKDTAGQVLYYFLEDTGYLRRLTHYKTVKEETIAVNISRFFDKLKKYEVEHEDASVPTVVDFIKMSMELGESPFAMQDETTTYDAVNLLTAHSAKGLEFPVVFLANLTTGRFPTRERREKIPIPQELIKEILPIGNYHILEERRLFYVGLTRAMDSAYLTASQFYGAGIRERKLSPFVFETLGVDFVEEKLAEKKEERKAFAMLDFKKTQEASIKKGELPEAFSFSQLETYLLCPLRYKYQYILKIPTIPTSAASFGTTIHKALQLFYQEFLRDRKIGLEQLLQSYKASWVPIGYASKTHENRMKKEGERMLTRYFKTFHNPDLKIIDLEKVFKIKVGDITISGKIDRVDNMKRGGIEIIDYKTGKIPKEKELKENLQLSIYLLAATDKGLYNKPFDEVTLSFYYLQNLEKFSMKKTEEDIVKVKDTVKQTVREIKKGDYPPHVGPWCDFCPFRMICEAWQ
ncbi:ATP-dependent helicase [Candidatus Roizmanbacteria bacterium]|nr:ATP-dependent helicase [Candidatus Roizmanbacteria bacterium]